MKKKIITGAVIAIAAGLATFFYKRRRNRLNALASDTYTIDETLETENYY